MIQTAIGLPSNRKGNPVYAKMQAYMAAHGLTPYMPQLQESASYNIAAAFPWNLETGTLNPPTDPSTSPSLRSGETSGGAASKGHLWTEAMIAAVQKFAHPPVFTLNSYYHTTHPNALAWNGVSQRKLTFDELKDYLTLTRLWFRGHGIPNPEMLVDEPPHAARYGWTLGVEDGIVKFVGAAVAAGWTIGVAVPGPSQLAFWRDRIAPTRWILHAKHAAAEYGPVTGERWLYNAATYDGLGKRMHDEGYTGYLQWSGVRTTKVGPVPILFDADGEPTPSAGRLLEELHYVVKPPVEPPVIVPTDLDKRLSAFEARLAAVEHVIAVISPPPPVDEQPVDLALFYSDSIADWKRELATLATYPTVVIQAEFATATATSDGQQYAGGRTPLAALKDNRVDVMLYCSPWWVQTKFPFGGPAEWLRSAQRAKLDATNGWLMDKAGVRVDVFSGRMSVADPRKAEYVDWLAGQLIALPHDKLFIDNAFYNQGAYHQWLISNEEWGAAVTAFYAKLRAAGKKLVLNGGWEPLTGEKPWTFPLRDFCDAVAIEMPAGCKTLPNWDWWSLYNYKPLGTTLLEEMVQNWKAAGKDVFLVASAHRSDPVGRDETPFVPLAEHRFFWRSLARKLKVSVGAQESTSDIPPLEAVS